MELNPSGYWPTGRAKHTAPLSCMYIPEPHSTPADWSSIPNQAPHPISLGIVRAKTRKKADRRPSFLVLTAVLSSIVFLSSLLLISPRSLDAPSRTGSARAAYAEFWVRCDLPPPRPAEPYGRRKRKKAKKDEALKSSTWRGINIQTLVSG